MKRPELYLTLAFVVVLSLTSGFVLGVGSETFSRAEHEAKLIAMIKWTRERCFLKFPGRKI